MDGFIHSLLNEFETGKLSRRKLIETLTVAAMTAYAANTIEGSELVAAPAAAPPDRAHLNAILVNHISYACPDYRKTRDFYADLMGMVVSSDRPDASNPQYGQCSLVFGAKGEKPFGAPEGTPLTWIIARSRNPNPPPPANANAAGQRGAAQQPQPQSLATIDHMGYTIADWNVKRVEEELKRRGLNPRPDSENSFHVYDANGYDLQICGVGMTAYN